MAGWLLPGQMRKAVDACDFLTNSHGGRVQGQGLRSQQLCSPRMPPSAFRTPQVSHRLSPGNMRGFSLQSMMMSYHRR